MPAEYTYRLAFGSEVVRVALGAPGMFAYQSVWCMLMAASSKTVILSNGKAHGPSDTREHGWTNACQAFERKLKFGKGAKEG